MSNEKNQSWIKYILVPIIAALIAFSGWAIGYGSLSERTSNTKEEITALAAEDKILKSDTEKLRDKVQTQEVIIGEVRTQLLNIEKSLSRIEHQLEREK